MDANSEPAAPQAAASSNPAGPTKAPDVFGQVRGVVEEGKAKITTSLEGFVKSAHEIGDQLQASGVGPVARYAHQGAEMVAAWSTSINSKSLEDLFDDARDFVRRNPALASGVALIAGFVVVRLFKAGASPAMPSH